MKNKDFQPSDKNVIVIEREETDEPNKLILKAVMTDLSERKVDVGNKSVMKPEISKKTYSETIILSEEVKKMKPVAIQSTNKTNVIVEEKKPRKMKIILAVTTFSLIFLFSFFFGCLFHHITV